MKMFFSKLSSKTFLIFKLSFIKCLELLCEYGAEYKLKFIFVLYKYPADPRLYTEKRVHLSLLWGATFVMHQEKNYLLELQLYILKIFCISFMVFSVISAHCVCVLHLFSSELSSALLFLSSTVSNLLLNLLIGIISVIIFFIDTFHLVLLYIFNFPDQILYLAIQILSHISYLTTIFYVSIIQLFVGYFCCSQLLLIFGYKVFDWVLDTDSQKL